MTELRGIGLQLIGLIDKGVIEKESILSQLYNVGPTSSDRFKKSAHASLSRLVHNVRKKGFDLENTRTRIYYREDY